MSKIDLPSQSTATTNGVVQVASGAVTANTALANGTTATTQAAHDNSTKVATTAYADAAGGGGGTPGGSSGQVQYNNSGAFGGFTTSGDATINTSTGVLTIANSAVTYAKMQNVSANSKLLGSGASGSGAPPSEITLGTGLSMTGTTLNNSSGGTVTSVALTVPAEFSVSGSPITTSGTLAITKANENANLVWAGPQSGAAAAPTFRSLIEADVPHLSQIQLLQFAANAANSGSFSTTFPVAVRTGSTILVVYYGGSGSPTISDTGSNSYTTVNAQTWVGGSNIPTQYYSVNVVGGSSFSVTSPNPGTMQIYEFSNVLSVDANASAASTGTSVGSGSLTTTAGLDVLFMSGACSNTAATGTNSNNWKTIQTVNNVNWNIHWDDFYGTVETAGSVSATYTQSATAPHNYAALIALKPRVILPFPAFPPFETNSVNNAAQDALNLVAGTNVTLTNSGHNVTIAASAGTSGFSPYPAVLTPPLTANFSFLNPNSYSVTATDATGRLILTIPPSALGVAYMQTAALPSTPYTIDVAFMLEMAPPSIELFSMALKNSGGNAIRSYGPRIDAAGVASYLNDQSWTSVTAPGTQNITTPVFLGLGPLFFYRITDNGTTRGQYFSWNGKDYSTWLGQATGTGLTPDRAGMIFYNNHSAVGVVMSVYHWNVANSILPQFAP